MRRLFQSNLITVSNACSCFLTPLILFVVVDITNIRLHASTINYIKSAHCMPGLIRVFETYVFTTSNRTFNYMRMAF